jgi:hypothetical protein
VEEVGGEGIRKMESGEEGCRDLGIELERVEWVEWVKRGGGGWA